MECGSDFYMLSEPRLAALLSSELGAGHRSNLANAFKDAP